MISTYLQMTENFVNYLKTSVYKNNSLLVIIGEMGDFGWEILGSFDSSLRC